ncbi:acid protease [Amanita muscaria]
MKHSRQEPSGGADGVVVPLQLIGSGMYDAAYTVQVKIGSSKSFSLQVDTGSSDLWVASSSCSTSSCSSSNLYNPSSATQTGVTFDISYLRGSVSGPVVWDHVQVGGYTIDNQALAAATTVTNEPLSSSFSGILGLALPLNSIIAHLIPPVTDNSPDGAAWASNLFSLTPPDTPPSSHFISLSLSRPGSDRVPALLGIGQHPSSIVSDPSKILYSSLVSDSPGTLYWKVSVRAITVYVDGDQRPISIGRSNSGAVFPTAVLDSGIPYILTTSKVANAIYGALGISPAADGNCAFFFCLFFFFLLPLLYHTDYVPCTTPLNMTLTLDNRPEIPLHPLDLTAEPTDNNQAQYCVGMIQVADAQLSSPSYGIGDMILGVPFLRNTYTVMAYTTPDQTGSFPDPNNASSSTVQIQPRLGLLGLTDPVTALNEFHTVRVLNQPISSAGGNNSSNNSSSSSSSSSKKLSVGLIVLLGLIGFFSLCCALFGLRWFLLKRRFRAGANGSVEGGAGEKVLVASNVKLSNAAPLPPPPSTGKSTITTTSTRSYSDTEKKPVPLLSYSPLGAFSPSFEDVRLEGTLAPTGMAISNEGGEEEGEEDTFVCSPRVPIRSVTFPTQRIDSEYTMSSGRTFYYPDLGGGKKRGVNESFGSKWSVGEDTLSGGSGRGKVGHERNPSLSAPLLSHQHRRSHSFGSLSPERAAGLDMAEFGYRLSRVPRDEEERRGEVVEDSSMAGIGSAARARRRLDEFDALPFPRTSSYYSTRDSAGAADAGLWKPGFPPLLPETTTEDVEEPIPVTMELEEPIPVTEEPIPPFPSMSGLRTSNGHRSWLDEFDPYLETTGPR